jgi:hypothetical protein
MEESIYPVLWLEDMNHTRMIVEGVKVYVFLQNIIYSTRVEDPSKLCHGQLAAPQHATPINEIGPAHAKLKQARKAGNMSFSQPTARKSRMSP